MENQISQLKQRILGRRSKYEKTELTEILYMAREFGCLGEIIGRDFEVKDPKGNLVYTIRQKSVSIGQLRILLKELATIKETESKAGLGKSDSKIPRRLKKK